jgi:hypothetical protein
MTAALRALIAIAAVAVFALIVWTQATAWVFYIDQRTVSRSSQVGRITVDLPEGKSTGTGFLVSECEVLTNFHVVFGPWYVTAPRPPSPSYLATFELTEVRLADGSHPTAKAMPIAWGDYSGPDRQFRKPAEDWVLLVLDSCIGIPHGSYTLIDPAFDDDMADNGGVAAIGYSAGRQMIDAQCSIRQVEGSAPDGALLHDCATLKGDSGGPIVKRGTNRVVAIASGYRAGSGNCASAFGYLQGQWNGGCTNIAVPLSYSVIARIESAMIAVETQRELLRLGYDAGTFGDIRRPVLAAAIRAAQKDLGFPVTGASGYAFETMLYLRAWEFDVRQGWRPRPPTP